MALLAPTRARTPAAVAAATLFAALLLPSSAPAQILPWEIVVAQIETGRLRSFAERLAKQNLLYQLHLGETTKSDLIESANRIDHILDSLEHGNPSYSTPAPWTKQLEEQVQRVDAAWGPLRAVATASPYEYFNVTRQFAPADRRRRDPLLLRYFDDNVQNLIAESDKLLALYSAECKKNGIEVCEVARATGLNAMLIERATKQAIYVVAGIDVAENQKGLEETLEQYHARREANERSPFFASALNPERSPSAAAGAKLLASLRADWDVLRKEFHMLAAGDEQNFDLRRLLDSQQRLVDTVERLTAALVRYASVTYGA